MKNLKNLPECFLGGHLLNEMRGLIEFSASWTISVVLLKKVECIQLMANCSDYTVQARDVTGTHTKCATTGNILIFNIRRHCNDAKTILASSPFTADLLR